MVALLYFDFNIHMVQEAGSLLNVASESLQSQAGLPALNGLSCENNCVLKVVGLASDDQESSSIEEDKVEDGVTGGLELVVE